MADLSVSGAASGIDTAGIIDKLVAVEGNQQALLKNKAATAKAASDAYGDLLNSARTLATQARAVANTPTWIGVSASSSSTSVTATARGNIAAALTFDVTALAKAHAIVSSSSVVSDTTVVASGSVSLTKGGTTTSINVGDGSLASTVAAINAANLGVVASTVQTAPGSYRLQLSATATGADSSFTLSGVSGLGTLGVLTTGADAVVTVGDVNSAQRYSVTSKTNDFANLLPGVDVTVSKLENAVTVSTVRDGTAIAKDVQSLVDSANALLKSAKEDTAYDVTTKKGGPLLGSSAVRTLQQSVTSSISGSGAPGLTVARDGTITFDAAAFKTAYAADPAKVAAAFGATATFAPASGVSGGVSLVRSGDTTRPGTYAVNVTVAAERRQLTVSQPAVTPPATFAGQTVIVTRGTQTVSYTVGNTESIATAIATINARLAGSGVGVTAVLSGANSSPPIVFTAANAGASSPFTVSVLTGGPGTAVDPGTTVNVDQAGKDVVGTINGQPATGSGSLLTSALTSGATAGLAVNVTATAADITAVTTNGVVGDIGSLTFKPGVAQNLLRTVAQASSASGGLLTAAQNGQDSTIKDLNLQIAKWDTRLADRRASLTKQFTAMEVAIQKLKSQSTYLASYGVAETNSSASS